MGIYEAISDCLKQNAFKFEGKRIAIWGAGKMGRITYTVLAEMGLDCCCFLDGDSSKAGTRLFGKEIVSPLFLTENKEVYILVAMLCDKKIREELKKMGVTHEGAFLLVCSEMEAGKPENRLLSQYLLDDKEIELFPDTTAPYLGSRYVNDGMYVAQIDGMQARARDRVYDRLASGKTVMEETACPCGSREFLLLSEKDRYGVPVRVVICRRCGIIFQNPRMTQEGFDQFYREDFSAITFNNYAAAPEDYFFWRKKDGPPAIYECVKDILKPDIHILEIGCGAGGVLDRFREIGCQVTGIDLDGEYIAYGKSRGLDLYCCHADEFEKKDGRKFDIVILAHVLEHFLDIGKELNIIKKLLKPQGFLYVELPGIKGFSLGAHQYDFLNSLQLAHTYYFDRDTFVQMMSWYGFRCVKSNEYISSLFQIDEKCAMPIENHCSDILRFLKHLEVHRNSLQKGIYGQVTGEMQKEAGDGNEMGR